MPVGLGDDPVDGGQPQPSPGALRLGGEERLEHVLGDVGGHSGAAIADPQPHVAAKLCLGPPGDSFVVHGDVAGVDGQRAAAGHGVAGVDGEVHQHLLQLARIGHHRTQVTAGQDDQLDMLADGPDQHLLHPGNDLVQVENLRSHHLPAGESEQLVREAGRPFGGQLDLPDVAAGRFPALGPVRVGRASSSSETKVSVVDDHGEEVVEVMRDPAGQLAEVLQALGLLQPRLQMFIQLNSLTALAVPPRVESVLNLQGVATHALDLRLDLVLCVAGLATLGIDFNVEPLLGVAGMAALRVDFLVEPLLGVAGIAAFGADFDVEPLLSLPRVAALALDPRLDVVMNSPRRPSTTPWSPR